MGNSKVQVTVYFESMCPGCHDFITKILNPALDDLNEMYVHFFEAAKETPTSASIIMKINSFILFVK